MESGLHLVLKRPKYAFILTMTLIVLLLNKQSEIVLLLKKMITIKAFTIS